LKTFDQWIKFFDINAYYAGIAVNLAKYCEGLSQSIWDCSTTPRIAVLEWAWKDWVQSQTMSGLSRVAIEDRWVQKG